MSFIDPMAFRLSDDEKALYRDLANYLSSRRSVRNVEGVSFFASPVFSGHECIDMYGTFPYGLFAVPEGAVFGASGILFSHNHPLIEQNAGLVTDRDLLTQMTVWPCGVTRPDEVTEVEHGLSLISSSCYCFWHWMMDCLPKVVLAEATGYTGSYLVPSKIMTPWVDESLLLLGIDPSRTVRASTNIIRCRYLYIPTYFSGFAGFGNLPLLRAYRRMIRKAVDQVECDIAAPRLFIARKEHAQFRRILNQADVQTLVQRYGFTTMYFEDYPLTTQLTLASRASTIIGPHGSGMTHTLFMPDRSAVIELFPYEGKESCECYRGIMPVADHRYESIYTEVNHDTAIEVNLSTLETILSNLADS